MKYSALALLGLLAVSVFASMQQAYALDPITFTTKASPTSANPIFQRVYENGTNSVIFTDAGFNGTYYQRKYAVATGGLSSNSATITNAGDTVNGAAFTSPVETTGQFWTVGRSGSTGKNIYALRSANDLSAVNATSQTSSYVPLDIFQSKTKLYTPLARHDIVNGDLQLGSINRAYTSYSESTALYAGGAATPGYALYYDVSGVGSNQAISSTNPTTVAQRIESGSSLIGQKVNGVVMWLAKSNSPTGTATVGVYNSAGTLVHTFGTKDVSTLSTGPHCH